LVRLLLEYSLGYRTENIYSIKRPVISEVTNRDSHIIGSQSRQIVKTHSFYLEENDPVIYVVRDGRDATISYWHFLHKRTGSGEVSFSEFLRNLYNTGDWWANHVYQWIVEDQREQKLIVRFEDLVSNQSKELDRMLNFLEVQPVCKYSEFSSLVNFSFLNEKVPNFFRSGKVGQWKEEFTDEDLKFFIERDNKMLVRLGYLETQQNDSQEKYSKTELDHENKLGWKRRYAFLEKELVAKDQQIEYLSQELELRLQHLNEKEQEIHRLKDAAEQRLQIIKEKEHENELLRSQIQSQL